MMQQFIDKVENINNVPQYSATLTGKLSASHTIIGELLSQSELKGELSLPKEIYATGLLPYEANTTQYWDSYRIPSKQDTLYVYIDYIEGEGTPSCVSFKWGDGQTNVRDLPFCNRNVEYEAHINDNTIHITQQEREYWNNKERAVTDEGMLVFIK